MVPSERAIGRQRHLLAAAGLGFLVIRLGGATWSFAEAAAAQNADLAALSHVAPYARVASFVGHPCRSGWNPYRMDHLPSFAIVRDGALTNDQWDIAGAQWVRPIYPVGDARYTRDPSQVVTAEPCGTTWSLDAALSALPRDSFDDLWLIDPPPFDARYLNGMTKIWENGSSALYRIAARPAQ
jgi:hypothetical protein